MVLGGRDGPPGVAAERVRQPRLGARRQASARRRRLADPQLPQREGLACNGSGCKN